MSAPRLKNYRKAKKNECPCLLCVFYRRPFVKGQRGHCYVYVSSYNPAVGRKMTCDAAEKREQP